MRDVLFFVFAAVVLALSSSEDALVNDILVEVRAHTKTNFRFAELESAVLLKRAGTSPIQEIASMADMMIIQITHEQDASTLDHTKYQGDCNTNKEDYAQQVREKKIVESSATKFADADKAEWIPLEYGSSDGQLLSFPGLKQEKAIAIGKAENLLQAAKDLRAKKHLAYVAALNEHEKALEDVKKIREILQTSNLDNKAKISQTVGAGHKSAAGPAISKLVELKQTVHPRLTSLIELSHKAMSTGSAIDKIYELLYQVRDQLIASKNKLVQGEQQAVSNWRTNKIAFRNDINDLIFNKATLHLEEGTCKKKIGDLKLREGKSREVSAKAVKVKEDHTILRNFLIVACDEEQSIYASSMRAKDKEITALKAVQERLRELKWSTKVFNAIQKVSEGITYLKGEYNIRSQLDRYMVRDVKNASFAPSGLSHTAGVFTIAMNPNDLSYSIISRNGTQRLYLTERDEKVYFTESESKYTAWLMVYDKESQSVFIRNQKTRNTLFVDAKNKFLVTTLFQTTDKQSQFLFDRPGYSVVGCYRNKINKGFASYLGADNKMSTEICYNKCKAKGTSFTHFGLSEGHQCYCGNTWWKEKAPTSDCGMVCSATGDGDLCGGSKRTLVYQHFSTPKPVIIQNSE